MPGPGCWLPGCCWLLQGEGDGGAEELEGAALDGCGLGELGDVLVGGGELGERGAQVPGEVGGEHGDQDVAADAFAEVVADGAQVQVVGFDDAEVPLDVLKVLVGGDHRGGAEGTGGDAGADHVDPVKRGLGGYLLLVAAAGEAGVGDLGDEVLGDLVLADDFPGPFPDLPGSPAPPGGR